MEQEEGRKGRLNSDITSKIDKLLDANNNSKHILLIEGKNHIFNHEEGCIYDACDVDDNAVDTFADTMFKKLRELAKNSSDGLASSEICEIIEEMITESTTNLRVGALIITKYVEKSGASARRSSEPDVSFGPNGEIIIKPPQ